MADRFVNKHFCSRRKNKKKFDRFGAFDIETDGLNAKAFILGVVYDGESFYDFFNADDMFKFMCTRKYRNYKWYGHNVEYDLSGFVSNIITDLEDVIFSGSRLIMAKKHYFSNEGKTQKADCVTFLDTFNLFNCSLKKVGAMIGINKLEVDFSKCTKPELLYYCRRDVEITYKAVEFFNDTMFELFGINIGMTVGSTALKVFASNFHNDTWYKLPRSYNDFWRKAYYGGRCEVFIKGLISQPIYHYDINSLYPYAMSISRFSYPNDIKLLSQCTTEDLIIMLYKYTGCTDVLITSPDIHIPFLPYRDANKLLFPVGSFRGVYNFNELLYALNLGYKINEVYRVAYSESDFNPFAQYVSKIYNMRLDFQKNKNPAEYLMKYLLNSLYGKFGEKHKDIVYGYEHEHDKYKHGSFFSIKDLPADKSAFGYFAADIEQYTNHTFYNICSTVTSQSRMILYDYIKRCNPKDLIYCDTDSLFLLKPYPGGIGSELGGLKLEGIYDYGIFLKPKMYSVESPTVKYTKIKGIPSSVTDIYKTTFKYDKVIKSKEALRRKLTAGLTMPVIKEITFDDEKRISDRVIDFYKNCITTTPLKIKP